MLALAWKHGGEDPYCLYHYLDGDLRPRGNPEANPRPPAYPRRVRAFTYACGVFSERGAQKGM